MVYFLQAAQPVPLVPWDPENRAVHLDHVAEAESAVSDSFPESGLVYYLGSHLNCGCGFRCETLGQEPGEAEAKQRSHEALADYLGALPPEAWPIRIYGIWTGDRGQTPLRFREVAVERLAEPDFEFRERELLTVIFGETPVDR